MRPEISGVLEDEVEGVYEAHGFSNPHEFVRQSVRRMLNDSQHTDFTLPEDG